MKKAVPVQSASAALDAKMSELGDWRSKTFTRARAGIIFR